MLDLICRCCGRLLGHRNGKGRGGRVQTVGQCCAQKLGLPQDACVPVTK